jgi:hypothetical protein
MCQLAGRIVAEGVIVTTRLSITVHEPSLAIRGK